MNSVFFFIWGELLPAAQLNFHLFVSPTCYFYTDLSFFRVFVCNFVFHAASVYLYLIFFFPTIFHLEKHTLKALGDLFFFPFTNRTHLLLFLFHVTSINITETSNRLCVWLSPLSRSLPAAQPASISVNGQRS